MRNTLSLLALLAVCSSLSAQGAKTFDAAAAFGARPTVSYMRMSPDGQNVAYLAPTEGQGTVAYTLSLAPGAQPKVAMRASGKPDRLAYCDWISNARVICDAFELVKDPTFGVIPYTRMVAANADGTNFQLLSRRDNVHMHGLQLGGGYVIDALPQEDSAVLMTRVYLPDDRIGTRFGSKKLGLGVDWVDTRNLSIKSIEPPRTDAVEYITDGHGTIRIVGLKQGTGKDMYQDDGVVEYMYRPLGSHDWHTLGQFNFTDKSGFNPYAVDATLNVAYGLKKKDGRYALYAVTLSEPPREELVYANPDYDLASLITIGRQHRVVGVSYVAEVRKFEYFDPQIKQLLASLQKALPQTPVLHVTDSSLDESRLLILAGSDSDPGVYYIFDRKTHQLQTFLVVRGQLEGVKLASVKPMFYPAADGVMVPGYLTLPPGAQSLKGLPAIVLPHGGPSARDEWGFDWLSQFYAARGFAVLQPNFRGSSGYGDAWFRDHGFKSWELAIGDVLAAGRWLVSQGVDGSKLAILGWSYGGYAALQSAVTDPSVFKAVVAIAPVTDLAALKEERRRWSDYELVSQYVGEGPHVREGSPAEHADKIKVPVLLFHGEFDGNVNIEQSKRMCSRLNSAGGHCQLVTWDDLDHYLEDSAARTQMLRQSDEFLRHTLGL